MLTDSTSRVLIVRRCRWSGYTIDVAVGLYVLLG